MSKPYSPKDFFRPAPNALLARYFTNKNVLTEIDVTRLKETKIDPIYKAWLQLPERTRSEIEYDFQAIHAMASESGSKAILDEANWHGENLAAQFSCLEGVVAHIRSASFWLFRK